MHDEKHGQLLAWLRLLRPRHWLKNGFVLAPLLFSGRFVELHAWLMCLATVASFCLASSSVYVLNDILDRERDRNHPDKRHRPLAAGRVSLSAAAWVSLILAVGAVASAWLCSPLVAVVVLAYIGLQIAYSTYLKQKMLLDVICIAIGFVLRAIAGGVAISVVVSYWLLICTFTLCMFMGFCKRRSEVLALGDAENAANHRATLAGYSPELLAHLVTTSAGVAIVSFLQYATSEVTIARFGSEYLVYSLPLVVYGIFRFAMLSLESNPRQQVEILTNDRPLQLTIILWLVFCFVVIVWGASIKQKLEPRSPPSEARWRAVE